ncbi:hypothetical protein HETIRDRAFT_165845 [Heterobasidion irregulare TC 32-1]|uniref:Uncharacterized protein n=1 Tax=Heterobasidion irregulare (strain TC 32-1) TaxID=747525 RepID=W4KIN1_HETIT|nr:uncharacterized protein HETIRDRAFT_165845 [Heterobasidion irregulare TC 32-1]ETW84906.1 hypothetical protein HETIRDRAFT_165845 [Heterobasidion irregulare TC 32-1]
MPQLLCAFEESISNQGEWKHFSRIGVQGHKAVLSFQALPRTRDARDKRKSRDHPAWHLPSTCLASLSRTHCRPLMIHMLSTERGKKSYL